MNADIAHRSAPKVGENVNGDAVLVRRDESGRSLIAVADGLGHGPVAAEASRAAIALLEATSLDTPMIECMRMLHEDLHRTRGAALTVCMIRGRQMEACAVGNVALFCTNTVVPLVMSAGILGHSVRTFRVCSCEIKPGSRLALASDGISTRMRLEEFKSLKPALACEAIFGRFRRNEDDATILIADMEG